jgi:hypothetical protein
LRLLLIYFWHADEVDAGGKTSTCLAYFLVWQSLTLQIVLVLFLAELGECVAALQSAGGEEHALAFLKTIKQQKVI